MYKHDDGTMQDYIAGPFDQTIKTANFPVLASIIGLAYDRGTPFQAEVYFINLAQIVQVKFGIPFFDVYDPRFDDFGVPVAVRGTISFKITDYCQFIKLHRLSNFNLDDFQKQIRAFSELYQDEPKNIEKHKKIIESSGYSFATIKGEKVAIATSGTSIGEKYFFQESIRRKMKKFPQYRIKFERTGLAILLPDIPTSYAENHFSEWISECQVEPENMYDFVYVISHRFCIYYDVHTNTTEKRSLKENESRSLATIGRMTAEGKLTLEDTEWL